MLIRILGISNLLLCCAHVLGGGGATPSPCVIFPGVLVSWVFVCSLVAFVLVYLASHTHTHTITHNTHTYTPTTGLFISTLICTRLRSQCTNLIIVFTIIIIINNEVGCNNPLFQILHLGVADNIDILI